MSFAGHVFDMIRRNKEDREKLKQLRTHKKEGRIRYSSPMPHLSLKEFEKIKQQTKERELQEEHYFSRMTLFFVGISLVVAVLLLYFFKFIVF